MKQKTETLVDATSWWRIAEKRWDDPLDPTFAGNKGGRWNPPKSYATLYLSEDEGTARMNMHRFARKWPYEPEELSDVNGPVLVECRLPSRQVVCDAHTPEGLAAAGLPATYPISRKGHEVPHALCQPVGAAAKASGLRGVHCRSAADPTGNARELAWFPATARSVARKLRTLTFDQWFYR